MSTRQPARAPAATRRSAPAARPRREPPLRAPDASPSRTLAAFDGLGLDDVEMDAALTLLLGFVQSVARADLDTQAPARESAMSDEQWWAANAPLLARVFDPARFPLAARVGSAAGEAHQGAYNPEHAFSFGLQRVLDGLTHLIVSRSR